MDQKESANGLQEYTGGHRDVNDDHVVAGFLEVAGGGAEFKRRHQDLDWRIGIVKLLDDPVAFRRGVLGAKGAHIKARVDERLSREYRKPCLLLQVYRCPCPLFSYLE